MKASDIMSSPVISVPPDATVRDIAGLLFARRIGAVPVLDGERLVGLVSEADVLRRRQPGSSARRARDIMTREVETVNADTPVEEVAAFLEERGIKRVPVLKGGRVVGIVSRSNLVQALAVQAFRAAPHPEDDEAIRTQLLSRLQAAPWWQEGESNVVVRDGVVHFWGRYATGQAREAAVAVAQGIPGVRSVEDHRVEAPKPPPPREPRIRRAGERGHSKHGWVDAYHSFSFGNFYDPAYTGYGPLQAINEKRIQPGKGSTTYGLRDIEVITYVLDGAIAHDDSLDNSAVLPAGGVQCVSAGSGVRFTEANASSTAPSHFLQIWIEPDCVGLPAAYANRRFAPESKRGRLQAIVSGDGRDGSLRMRQDALLYAGLFDGAERAQLEISHGRLAYVHVARGVIAVQGQRLGAGDGLSMASGTVVLERGENAEVLVFDLPELEQQPHQVW